MTVKQITPTAPATNEELLLKIQELWTAVHTLVERVNAGQGALGEANTTSTRVVTATAALTLPKEGIDLPFRALGGESPVTVGTSGGAGQEIVRYSLTAPATFTAQGTDLALVWRPGDMQWRSVALSDLGVS